MQHNPISGEDHLLQCSITVETNEYNLLASKQVHRSAPLRAIFDPATRRVKLTSKTSDEPPESSRFERQLREKRLIRTFWQDYHDWELVWKVDQEGRQTAILGVDGAELWRVNLDTIFQFLSRHSFDRLFQMKIMTMGEFVAEQKTSLEIDYVRVYQLAANSSVGVEDRKLID